MSTKPGAETPPSPIGLFEGFGLEIEYMIVSSDDLDVAAVADRLLEAVAGSPAAEVQLGALTWSNELVLHVLEVKTSGPARSLRPLPRLFHQHVERANRILEGFGCRLLPGGMHPWMDPTTETRMWPHEYNEVYRAFDRIFSCRGHGWANLQSTHLNLPFQGDREFRILHGAIRLLLPLLPALAASSPIREGRVPGPLDVRLVEYAQNSRRIPSVAGLVIPDEAASEAGYRREVLGPIYRDLAPHDPDGVLLHEWVNGRGAIPRFERNSIEIRLLDPQECPAADLAVVSAVVRCLSDLCARAAEAEPESRWVETPDLARILDRVIWEGDRAPVDSAPYLSALGLDAAKTPRTARAVWQELLDRASEREWVGGMPVHDAGGEDPLVLILKEGPLSRRILRRVGTSPSRAELMETYRELASCLASNRMFA